MKEEFLFERDILYPTDNRNEPGSVHIQVANPNRSARIPVIIESKSGHSPVKYLDSILRIMQSDVFDRIFIDVRKTLELYIKVTPEMSKEYGGKAYVHITFADIGTVFTGADKPV